jgi:hypothetical protein
MTNLLGFQQCDFLKAVPRLKGNDEKLKTRKTRRLPSNSIVSLKKSTLIHVYTDAYTCLIYMIDQMPTNITVSLKCSKKDRMNAVGDECKK